MKFGVSLANIGSLGPGVGVQGCLDIAQAADQLGFDSICVGDHLLFPANIDYDETHEDRKGATRWQNDLFEPFTVLSAAAALTSNVRLCQGITIAPLRHPILMAKVGATIDRISNGRFVLAVGVGWMHEEFEALGLPEGYFERRGAVTNDYLRAIKELWTSDGPSSFSGEFVQFERVGAYPKPQQEPHPPIAIGGASRPAMRRAARLGNIWDCPADNPEQLASRIAEFRGICEAEDRDPSELEITMNWLLRPGAHGMRIFPEPIEEADRPPFSGSPGQIVEDLKSFEAVGLQHILTLPRAVDPSRSGTLLDRVLEGMQIVAREVLPAIR